MSDLQALFAAIEQLPPEEFQELRRFVEERDQEQVTARRAIETLEERLAALHAALAEFREGLSDEEMREIADAMNYEYIDPNVLRAYDWIDEVPEDKR